MPRAPVSELLDRANALGDRTLARRRKVEMIAPVIALRHSATRMIERLVHRQSTGAASSTAAAHIVGLGAVIGAKLVATRRTHPMLLDQARTITAVSVSVASKIAARGRARDTVSQSRIALHAVQRQIVGHAVAERTVREVQVRDTVMTSAALTCTVVDNQITADLSVLPDADRLAFLSLDVAVQRQMLLDRHKADEQHRQADETRRRDAERAHEAQVAVRGAQVADACRIVRETVKRPYRRAGRALHPDWSGLTPSERDIIAGIGVADLGLQAALIGRAVADARLDTEARRRENVPPPATVRNITQQNVSAASSTDGSAVADYRAPAISAEPPKLVTPPIVTGAARSEDGVAQHAAVPCDGEIDFAETRKREARAKLLATAATLREAHMSGWNAVRPTVMDSGQRPSPARGTASGEMLRRPAWHGVIDPNYHLR